MLKKSIQTYILMFMLSAMLLNAALMSIVQAEVSVKDDKNNIVVLEQPAERIISLALHIT